MSIRRLSEISGVHVHTIERWEYNGFLPHLKTVDRILNVLGYELTIEKRIEA